MMQIELNEQQAIALYRILCRWESTGKLTVSVGKKRACYGICNVCWRRNWNRWMRPSQKDLFEECSRTQLRVKDDEMILLRGITGFGSINTLPPLFLDEKAFCRMCHALALENGGTVTELDTDTYPRNFYRQTQQT